MHGYRLGEDLCSQETFTFKAKLEKLKMQKILEPRGERPILTERIGKGFSEKNTMKLDFEY